MKTYTRSRPIYSTRIPRHGKAKQQQQLIQKLKRRRRFRFRDRDAFPRVALFTEASIHVHWNHAHQKTQPTPVACHYDHHYDRSRRDDGSLPSISESEQRHRYPNETIRRPCQMSCHKQSVLGTPPVFQKYQIFFLYRKNISLPSGAYITRVPGAPSTEGL